MKASTALPQAQRGLISIFASTFFELVGYFMLLPLLLLRLKGGDVSTAVAGLFAATGWLGVFLVTPFASWVTRHLGRRRTLWLAAAIPAVASLGFGLTESLAVWFGLKLVSGMASGQRWVLAEAVVAEFSPPQQRGRYVGLFETMVGTTFVIGPGLLAWVGVDSPWAMRLCIGFFVLGVLGSSLIPPLPEAADAHEARVGLHGVWHALHAHPVIMFAGFTGGFFESGITSILPLYGLALGMGAAAATLLVAASGLGSSLMMLPAGMLADRMAHHPLARWGDARHTRLLLMRACAVATLVATLLVPMVAGVPLLAWPMVFVWGGAGGCLYTLAMIDIGSRESGITLVNSTAVLVLSYTLGGMAAPAAGAAALQWSPTLGFPALMLCMAVLGLLALRIRPVD